MDKDLTTIIIIIAAVAFIILVIALIISIRSFIKLTSNINSSLEILTNEVSHSLGLITKDINILKDKLVESLDTLDKTSAQLSNSIVEIEREANEVLNIFTPFKALANLAYSRIAPPVNRFTLMFSATTKAVSAFVDGLAGKI